jgi:hypothetical protein
MSEKKESIGGIWKKTIQTKNGDVELLNISVDGKRYTAWPNTYKQAGDKSPDYKLYLDTYKPPTNQQPNTPQKNDNEELPF